MFDDFSFLKVNFEKVQRHLEENPNPEWGVMTAQNMIEHLIMVTRISNGTTKIEVDIAEDKLAKSRAFMLSDYPMPRLFKARFVPETPAPNEYPTLAAAIEQLKNENALFTDQFVNNPDVKPGHPIFGFMNQREWTRIHNKHYVHHFEQFGLDIKSVID